MESLEFRQRHAAEEQREAFICAVADGNAIFRLVAEVGGSDVRLESINHVRNRPEDYLTRLNVERFALHAALGSRDRSVVAARRDRQCFTAAVGVLYQNEILRTPYRLYSRSMPVDSFVAT